MSKARIDAEPATAMTALPLARVELVVAGILAMRTLPAPTAWLVRKTSRLEAPGRTRMPNQSLFRNFSRYPCGEESEDVWSATCDDRCPKCNATWFSCLPSGHIKEDASRGLLVALGAGVDCPRQKTEQEIGCLRCGARRADDGAVVFAQHFQ